MEITFNKCVRCQKSMRNFLGMISLKRSCCPYCKLRYRQSYDLPFLVFTPWLIGISVLIYYLINIILEKVTFVGVLSLGLFMAFYFLYLSPLVPVRTTKK